MGADVERPFSSMMTRGFTTGIAGWGPAVERGNTPSTNLPRRAPIVAGWIFRRAITEPPNWIAGERSPMSGLISSAALRLASASSHKLGGLHALTISHSSELTFRNRCGRELSK